MSISDNIKRIREAHNLTQAQLGEIAGVSDKAISTWERGEAKPRMGAIEKMASYFGVRKSELIDDNYSDSSLPSLSATEQQHLFQFRQLNTEGQEKVSEYTADLVASGRYIKIDEDEMVDKEVS